MFYLFIFLFNENSLFFIVIFFFKLYFGLIVEIIFILSLLIFRYFLHFVRMSNRFVIWFTLYKIIDLLVNSNYWWNTWKIPCLRWSISQNKEQKQNRRRRSKVICATFRFKTSSHDQWHRNWICPLKIDKTKTFCFQNNYGSIAHCSCQSLTLRRSITNDKQIL